MQENKYNSMATLALVLLSFILGTSEFIVVGILPDIARDINCSITMAGNLISVFAFAYAIGTPFITAALSKYNKYYVLLCLVIGFILGNILCAIASNYYILVLARIFTAIISGVVLSISMTFVTHIASASYQAKVISWVFSGFSIASVFGVPIGTLISQLMNWRMTFFVLVIFSILILLLLWYYLPNIGKGKESNIYAQFSLLKNMRINYGMLIVIFGAGASYVFYTYLTPILQKYLQIPESLISLILCLFGISTIISNLLSGRIANFGGMKKMPIIYFFQAICLMLMSVSCNFMYLGLVNIFIIGVIMYLQNSPAQLHFLHTAKNVYPEAIALASSLNPVSFNIGIALGSVLGGFIVEYSEMKFVGIGGAILALAAMYINLQLLKKMSKFSYRK